MSERPPVTLSASDIHKSFGAMEVLKGISLQEHQGDVYLNTRASGSEKYAAAAALICLRRLTRA